MQTIEMEEQESADEPWQRSSVTSAVRRFCAQSGVASPPVHLLPGSSQTRTLQTCWKAARIAARLSYIRNIQTSRQCNSFLSRPSSTPQNFPAAGGAGGSD